MVVSNVKNGKQTSKGLSSFRPSREGEPQISSSEGHGSSAVSTFTGRSRQVTDGWLYNCDVFVIGGVCQSDEQEMSISVSS